MAQFAGAIAGAYLLYWMFTTSPLYNKSVQGLGADGYGKQSHLFVSQGGAFLIEVVLTTIFVLVVLFATHKAAIQGAAGVAIGFGLVIVHLIGIPLTGHLGEPGPEPRAGPGRRRHGAQPGLALHRRPVGRRDRGGDHPPGCWPTAPRTDGRRLRWARSPPSPLPSDPWI